MTRNLQTGLDTHEALFAATRRQAERALDFHARHGRFLRFVDTHQKWLLLHLIADTDAGHNGGIAVNWIAQRANELGIASRNTTLAFFGQLSAYGYLVRRDNRADRRMRLVSLASDTEEILGEWTSVLMGCLVQSHEAAPEFERSHLSKIYHAIARALLDTPQFIRPPVDVCLMQDIRGGWLVMNHLLTGIEHAECGLESVSIPDFTLSEHARNFSMSRSTIYRLFRLAEEAGLLGWRDQRGTPTLWMSGYHLRQYCRWNARLLAAASLAVDGVLASETPFNHERQRFFVPAAAEIRAPATRLA